MGLLIDWNIDSHWHRIFAVFSHVKLPYRFQFLRIQGRIIIEASANDVIIIVTLFSLGRIIPLTRMNIIKTTKTTPFNLVNIIKPSNKPMMIEYNTLNLSLIMKYKKILPKAINKLSLFITDEMKTKDGSNDTIAMINVLMNSLEMFNRSTILNVIQMVIHHRTIENNRNIRTVSASLWPSDLDKSYSGNSIV